MDFLWLVLIQLVALAAVIELFVLCMPGALRRASQQNCYRVDGTKSEHRTYRERRARNRLRWNMLAVLVLVFLTGNALYFTMESSDAPVSKLGMHLWSQIAHRSDAAANPNKLEAGGQGLLDQVNQPAPQPQVSLFFPLVLFAGWGTCCLTLVSWGAYRAYKSFAEGVNARGAEHFHLDMTRMSVCESQFIDAPSEKSSSKTGADVA